MYEKLISEANFRFSRSGGPGGQSVNKVSTQVELLFDIAKSETLSEDQKTIIFHKLKNRITSEGVLTIKSNRTRSQLKNKEIAIERFIELIINALRPVKKRTPTKPTKSSVERRLVSKKVISDKKKNRKVKED